MRPADIALSTDAAHPVAGRAGQPPLHVRWLGTAGFAIECAGTVVLIDPYVTRASLARCIAAPLRPDAAAIARHVPRADAIVVGHTHFDHALDVPAIARATGARVFGSRSAAALCLASGVPASRVDVVERDSGGEAVVREVGPFTLRFLPSAHSRFAFGRVPRPGDIDDCDRVPLRAHGYRCGAVFGIEIRVAGRTLYHVGSAELVDASARAAGVKNIDLVLLCVAGWTSSRDYPERVARSLDPGAVLLSHWDDFLRPIERPVRALPAMQLPRLVERLARAAPGVRIGTVAPLDEVWV